MSVDWDSYEDAGEDGVEDRAAQLVVKYGGHPLSDGCDCYTCLCLWQDARRDAQAEYEAHLKKAKFAGELISG